MQITWRWVLTAIAALVAMRIGGLTTNFWTGVGLLGFLLILSLLQTLTTFGRVATTAFIIWVAVVIGLPVLTRTFHAEFPILSPAVTRRSIDAEVRASEQVDPLALRGRIATIEYCRKKEQIEGGRLQGDLNNLLASHRAGTFGDSDRTREAGLFARLRDIADERRACQEQIEKATAKTGASQSHSLAPMMFPFMAQRWFAAIFLLLFAAVIISGATAPAGKRLSRMFWGVAWVAALGIVAYWFAFSWSGSGGGELGVRTGHVGDIRHLEVDLAGRNQWVRVAHLFMPCTPYKIGSGEVREGRIKFADGGEERLGDAGPDDFGRRDPVALKGEGTAHIWLFEPGKSCRRS